MHSFETHIEAQSCKASYVVFNRPSVQVVIEMRAQVLHKIGTIRCAGQNVLDTVCQTPFAKQNVEHKIIIKKCSTKCALENVQLIYKVPRCILVIYTSITNCEIQTPLWDPGGGCSIWAKQWPK